MAACGAAGIVLVALLLARLGASRLRLTVAVLALSLSPLALGPISLNTYDAWPALLTVAALAALVGRRELLGFALLGLAFAAKVYPVVLLPAALVFVWRTQGRRSATRALACFVVVALAVGLPFLVLAPHGLAESFRAQAARGLQLESFGAQLLVAADHIGLSTAMVVHRTSHAVSYDLVGSPARSLAAISSALQLAAVAAAGWLYARGRHDEQRLATAFAASVLGFLAFTRVFSPQYLVWAVPLVALLAGRAALVAGGLLATALALDQAWFFHYGSVVRLGSISWLVLLRDVLVVAVFAAALLSLRGEAPKDEDAVLLEDELPLRAGA